MATGKTNARWARFICDEFDLSGDTREIGEIGATYDEIDVTGLSDGVTNFTLGHPTIVMDGYAAVFAADSVGANRSFDVLSVPESRIISVPMGIRAAPAVSDPAFLHYAEQASFTHDGDGPILISASFPRGVAYTDLARPWGVVLAAGASIAVTTNGASVNNGAASTNGLTAFLHVTATAAGNWALKIQHSADDAIWVDLITFTADGSAVTAEVGQAAGTVNQYLRFQATRTGGTTTFWVTAARQ